MDALLMCGGPGTRLDADVEKPLFEVGGRPMVDRVRDALVASRIDAVYAVGSPAAPRTLEHVVGPTIAAPGDGYVADLQYALDRVDAPVLTVAADLPLLAGDAVDAVLDRHAGGSLSVVVPTALKRQLGVSADATAVGSADSGTGKPSGDQRPVTPTGVNVVAAAGGEASHVTWDARLAVNVNRLGDARVAEALV